MSAALTNDDTFPLTPTLSLGEREIPRLAAVTSTRPAVESTNAIWLWSPLNSQDHYENGASPKGRPTDIVPPLDSNHGDFIRKNLAGSPVLIGNAFENAPLASNAPARFVVQLATGAAMFVEVSHE